jgi:hypothetical protein
MAADLGSIADRMAITDLLHRYCRSMDRIDPELGYGVWHDDGTADYGPIFCGTGRAFVDWACERHRALSAHVHQLSNVLIEVTGDAAASECCVTVVLRYPDGGRTMQMTARGRYLDRWSRRRGRWGIDRRVYVQDFDDVREVAKGTFDGWGRRDREDPSYEILSPGD